MSTGNNQQKSNLPKNINDNESPEQSEAFRELIDAGFSIDEAKQALAISVNQNESNTEVTEIKEPTEHICICGKNLVKMYASLCYNGRGVNCNMCNKTYKQKQNIYHCVHKSHKHRNGFDICSNNCIHDYEPKKYTKTVIMPKVINKLKQNYTRQKYERNMDSNAVRVINMDNINSSISSEQLHQLLITDHPSPESFIISNSEQLIILIEFETTFNINHVHLCTLKQTIPYIHNIYDDEKKSSINNKISAPHPKHTHIFKIDGVNLDQDINEFKLFQLFTPQARINATSLTFSDVKKGLEKSMFNIMNAKSVKQIAIYIEANQGTERTYLNGINIKGVATTVVMNTVTPKQMIFKLQTRKRNVNNTSLKKKNDESTEEKKSNNIKPSNEENKKLFAKILDEYKDVLITKKSPYAVDPILCGNRQFSQQPHDCDLDKCQHLLRIRKILSKYNQFISDNECKLSDDETETNDVEAKTIQEKDEKKQEAITEVSVAQHVEQDLNEKDAKFLLKIFKKIIYNPNNKKYQNLNGEKVINTCSNNILCMQILLDAGFKEQQKDKRLIFDPNKLDTLKAMYAKLKQRFDNSFPEKQNNEEQKQFTTNNDSSTLMSKLDEINSMIQNNPEFRSLIVNSSIDPLQTRMKLNPNDPATRKLVEAVSNQLFNTPQDHVVNKILKNAGQSPNQGIMQEIRMNTMYKDVDPTRKPSALQLDTLLAKIPKMNLMNTGNVEILKDIHQTINDVIDVPLNENQNIKHIYHDDYDNSSLLNDFHHLLFNHDNQLEDIYDNLTQFQKCNASNCFIMRRNYRNRERNNGIRLRKMYFNLDDKYDLVQQQLLDKIHCYYHHSFDTAHRLSRLDIQRIETVLHNDNDSKVNDSKDNDILISEITKINQEKEKKIIPNAIANTNVKISKFSTIVDNENIKYSNGIRYFYWDYYKRTRCSLTTVDRASWSHLMRRNHSNEGYSLAEWYIPRAFQNLKEELLNNTICALSRLQWETLVLKAYAHFCTDHTKQIHCQHPDSQMLYGIKQKSPIYLAHLVAMMTYCNYDRLQRIFSETYRRIPASESDKSLKTRHSNYANLGRLLRECVECFGMNESHSDIQHLFHGITVKANFSSSIVCFKGPVSTSTDYSVAAKFCANLGMILDLNIDAYFSVNANYVNNKGIAMFDCHWISDFAAESEIFFVGGFANFTITNIIVASIGVAYGPYIYALNRIFLSITKDSSKHTKIFETIECQYEQNTIDALCFRLLSDILSLYYPKNSNYHRFKSMPEYVKKLVRSHFAVVSNVCLFNKKPNLLKRKVEDTILKQIMRSLFWYDFGWVNLQKLNKVFPSLTYLEVIDESHEFVFNEFMYLSILGHLKSKGDTKLRSIEINIAKEPIVIQKVKDICSKFEMRFNRLMFTLMVTESSFGAKIKIKSETTDIKSKTLQLLGSKIAKLQNKNQ